MNLIVKTFILIVVSIFFCCKHEHAGRQEMTTHLNPSLDSIVCDIAKKNMLTSRHVGYGGETPRQWRRYEYLRANAPDSFLVQLTDHENAVVRAYAFKELVARKNDSIFSILMTHLRDTAVVRILAGCTGYTLTVADYYYRMVTPNEPDSGEYTLSLGQVKTIDSFLIFNPDIELSGKQGLIYSLNPRHRYYPRIKSMAVTGKFPLATLALARFGDVNDAPIIRTLFDRRETEHYGVYAAAILPDTLFYPHLVKIFEKDWNDGKFDRLKWERLCLALAHYPREQTLELFERVMQSPRDFRYKDLRIYLMRAVSRHGDDLYSSLDKWLRPSTEITLSTPYDFTD